MADVDANEEREAQRKFTDAAETKRLSLRHKFVGATATAQCGVCTEMRIHDLHRGYDYEVTTTREPEPETIAEEAQRIVWGDREQTYDDPNQNFRRIAKMWSGMLDRKLAPGCEITPRDVALMFVQLKISRESFKSQRDNRVDMIGYTLCLDRIVQAEETGSAAK